MGAYYLPLLVPPWSKDKTTDFRPLPPEEKSEDYLSTFIPLAAEYHIPTFLPTFIPSFQTWYDWYVYNHVIATTRSSAANCDPR